MTVYVGTGSANSFNGTANADNAQGAGGNDSLNGSGGDDVLAGDAGADTLTGGTGNDTLYSGSISPAFSQGNSFEEPVPPLLDTGSEVDHLSGGDGDDLIFGGYGDTIDGGTGTDELFISFMGATTGVTADFSALNGGSSTLTIGGGTIRGVEQVGWIQGSDFADTITSGNTSSSAAIYGMGGADHINAGDNAGLIHGGSGDDVIQLLSSYSDRAFGDDNNDTITGGNASTVIDGGAGDDRLSGYGHVNGGDGNDTITGLDSFYYAFPLNGDAGDDHITTSNTSSLAFGGDGADVITGGDGADTLVSGTDQATYWDLVNYHSTYLDDGVERDRIVAGAGNDEVEIGYGDSADGGTGANTLSLSLGGATRGVTLTTANLIGGTYTLAGGTIRNFQLLGDIWGSAFADTLTIAGATSVHGRGGNDRIDTTGAGNASVFGDEGNDTLIGGDGAETFDGGVGADRIQAGGGDDRIMYTGAGGAVSGEQVDGGAGFDTIVVKIGSDDSGDTDLSGMTITNVERLDATFGSAIVTKAQLTAFTEVAGFIRIADGGKVSLDRLHANYATFALSSTNTTISLNGVVGEGNYVFGGSGDDRIYGGDQGDQLWGGGGDDLISGGGGSDFMNGGDGFDTLDVSGAAAGMWIDLASQTATEGSRTESVYNFEAVTGSTFADTLYGTESANTFQGGAGDDRLFGLGGDDILNGGAGNDRVDGGAGTDKASYKGAAAGVAISLALTSAQETGGAGRDTLVGIEDLLGSAFNDTLVGDGGANRLTGDAGNDMLNGGLGADTLTGGDGADSFRFTATLGAGNVDTITDFSVPLDTIALGHGAFTGLSVGALSADAFFKGAAAHDASDRILYDATNGALLFDRDGSGSTYAAVQFATVGRNLSLTAADFTVI